MNFGTNVSVPKRADLRFQKVQLIGNILGMDDAYGRISRTVKIVQGATINQVFAAASETVPTCWRSSCWFVVGNATLQFVVDRIVERADFGKGHLRLMMLVHVVYPLFCWLFRGRNTNEPRRHEKRVPRRPSFDPLIRPGGLRRPTAASPAVPSRPRRSPPKSALFGICVRRDCHAHYFTLPIVANISIIRLNLTKA